MPVWNSFPMLRVLPPFVIGVVVTAFVLEWPELAELSIEVLTVSALVSVSIVLLIAAMGRNRTMYGLSIWGVMFVLGATLTCSVSEQLYPHTLSGPSTVQEQTYLIRIDDQPKVNERSVKVSARATDDSLQATGRVLLYFDRDRVSEQLKFGQVLLVRSRLEKVRNPGNPNEFNYSRYLRFHGIALRGFVKSGDFQLLSEGDPGIRGQLLDLRAQLISKLEQANMTGDRLAVASALILGYKNDLDKELMQAYAGAGATHVLAVSGLHVGIIYLIISWLLKFLDRTRYTRLLKTVLIIVLLFGYAALTGLSASVFRAATMFSFVAVGKSLQRNTNIYNTLAASAFCLIAFSPMIVMQVGFQLSYAAVLGIVLIQPRLFEIISFPNNKWLDRAWAITCVSVAAQIATAPLGLLYFHQFPNLFFISNLLVIPAAIGVLYLGILLFMFSFWPPALLFFGFLLNSLIYILNSSMVLLEQIPYAVLSGIDISVLETVLIYAAIGGFLLFVMQRSVSGLYGSLLLCVVFMAMQIVEVNEQKRQQIIAVYNINNETAVGLFSGTNVAFMSSKKLYHDRQSMLFHVRHHWWNRGVEHEQFIELNDSVFNRELLLGRSSLVICDLSGNDRMEADVRQLPRGPVVLHEVSWNRMELLPLFGTAQIVVSDRFGPKMKTRIREFSATEPYFVAEKGALLLEAD